MKIHHTGISVNNIADSKEKYISEGYLIVNEIFDEKQKAFLSLLEKDGEKIELIYSENPLSPVYKLCKKAKETRYHICYGVNNLEMAINLRKDNGFMQVSQIQYAPLLQGRICFMYSKEEGLIELYEVHL